MHERVTLSDLFEALSPEGMIPIAGDTGVDHDPAKGFPLELYMSGLKYTSAYFKIVGEHRGLIEKLRALPASFDGERHRLREQIAKIRRQARADGISLPDK